jgi:hypothetical protein
MMTKEEIIEMARKANCGHETMDLQWICPDNLEAFAKLIAEKEREENRSYIYELERELEDTQDKLNEFLVADYMKKVRGQE